MRAGLENWKAETMWHQVPRVILAEDDEELRSLLAGVLRRDGYDVVEASSGLELLELLADLLQRRGSVPCCELVVTDIRMPGATGLQVLETLRHRDWATPLMVITAFGDEQAHAEARRLGVAAMFDKPFDLDDFRMAVWNLLSPRAQ